jgi:hypothetical protein
MTVTTLVGDTQPKDFQITSNGAPLDATGWTVGLTVPVAGMTVEWLDAPTGTVRVTGHETLKPGQVKFRFKLTSGTGKVCYAPSGGAPDVWIVKKALA